METERLGRFEESLRRLNVGWTRVESDSFAETLNRVVEEPAVGSPLPFEAVSLADVADVKEEENASGTRIELDPTPNQLREAKTGVTAAAMGIADYGSLVVRSSVAGDELVSLFPERHVAVLRVDDVVADMPTAFERLDEEVGANRGDAVIATGPSATADMGELVYGAHGPKEVHVLVLEEE